MSSATTPIRLKVAADLGVTAGTIGLGNVENKTSAQIRAEIVAADLAGGGKAFSVLPASGATVGAAIGVNFTGQFTPANITNFFAAKVITAGIIDVTDLFAQAISVTDTVKVGSDTGRYLLTLDGRGTASPIAIIDKNNAGALVFGFDSDDKPYFGGGLRDGAIDSVNVFTDEVLTQLKPIVVGSTGGIFKVAGLPSMIGATLNKTVTVTPANPSSVLIGLSFSDYFLNIASSSNLNYTPPKYMVTIKRSLNGGAATTIHSQMYTGTALNQRDPEVNKWECSFGINVDIAISDINHAANNNDSITYTFTVTRSSGSYSAAKITAASCSQQTQGGGAAGVASQLTAPYVGLTASGNPSYPAMTLENSPTGASGWIRTPVTGLLPYASGGGSSSLGTASWQFSAVYAQAIYDNNNRVYSASNTNIGTGATNYAAGNHTHAYAPLTGGGTSGTWGISVSGNAASATKLATPRTINGVAFDGTANITISSTASSTSTYALARNDTRAENPAPSGYSDLGVTYHFKQNAANGFTQGGGVYNRVLNLDAWSGISGGLSSQMAFGDNGAVGYRPSSDDATWGAWKTFVFTGDNIGTGASNYAAGNHNHSSISGNAATATNLASISNTFSGKYPVLVNANGVVYGHTSIQFEGATGILTVPTVSGDLSGNASSATKLATARTIAITGAVTGTATAFDGTDNIAISATAVNASNLNAGTVPDARISGSYTGMANLTGSGTVDFAKFLGNAADTVAAPSFSWTGDTNTGMYWVAADQVGIATGGVQRALFNSSGVTAATFNGALNGNASTATTLQTARTIAISGAVTGTATSFNGSANITISATAVNASNLSSGTVPDARISGSYTGMANLTGSGTVDFAKFLGNASDTVAAPSFSWTGDTNTGIYSPAADQLAITTGGVQRALFNSSGVTAPAFVGPLTGNATTATKLQTARTIKIGDTAKNFDGGVNLTWALSDLDSNLAFQGTKPNLGNYFLNRHITGLGDVANTAYIILCENATGTNNCIGQIFTQRSSGSYVATLIDVLFSSGSTTANYMASVRNMGSSLVRLVSCTVGGVSVIALEVPYGTNFHYTRAMFTGMIDDTSGLAMTAVYDPTDVVYLTTVDLKVNGQSLFGPSNLNIGTGSTSYSAGNHVHTFAALQSKPTTLAGYGITDGALSTHVHTFAALQSKPTTLAGYGITDAAPLSHSHPYLALAGGTVSGSLIVQGAGGATPLTLYRAGSGVNTDIVFDSSTGGQLYFGRKNSSAFGFGDSINLSASTWATIDASGVDTTRDFTSSGGRGLIIKQSAASVARGIWFSDANGAIQSGMGCHWNAVTGDVVNFYFGVGSTPWTNRVFGVDNSGNGTFLGSVAANAFITRASNTDYSLLTRATAESALYVQNTTNGACDIASFQWGSAVANAGTKVLDIKDTGLWLYSGVLYFENTENYISKAGANLYIRATDTGGKVILQGLANPIARVNNVDNTIYHTGNLPDYIRADADDYFSGRLISTSRNGGIFGTYDTTKTDQIWSMGAAYRNAADGSNFGNLYGLAYKSTNNATGGTMAGGHQVVWCENGVPKSAMGLGLWTSGTVTGSSFVGNINASSLNTGTVPNARISGTYTGLANLTGSGTVDFAKFLGNAGDSASAPSFSWTGDTNTGIYQPAADKIGFATGGVSRGVFDSEGLDSLRVRTTGTGNDYSSGGVEIRGNGTTDTVYPTLGFHQPSKYAASIQLRGASDFRFYAQGAAAYANVTAGNVVANGTVHANGGLVQNGNVILNGSDTWLRTTGATGWHSATYGGGMYMNDTTWVRTYGGKKFFVENASDDAIYTSGGVTSLGPMKAKSWGTGNVGAKVMTWDDFLPANPPVGLEGVITANWIAAGVINARHLQIDSMVNNGGVYTSFKLQPEAAIPLRLSTVTSTGVIVEDIFSVDRAGNGFFKGLLSKDTVDINSIQEEARRQINPYYLGTTYGNKQENTTYTGMANGATFSLPAISTGGGVCNLSFKFATGDYNSYGSIPPLPANPEWKIEVFRGTTAGTLVFTKNYTGSVSRTRDGETGIWDLNSSISIEGSFSDSGAAASQVYVVKVTYVAGSPTTLYRRYFGGESPNFLTNTLLKNSNGYWKDKETGFIIQWGSLTMTANQATTVTLPIAFPNAICIALADNMENYNASSPTHVYAKSKTTISLINSPDSTITVQWMAYGY